MNDQERYDRFLSALGFRANLDGTPSGGVDLIDLDGEPVDPAVRLHVCPETLAAHVCDEQGVVPSARPSLDDDPDALDDAEASSLQSLLAQIEEAILVREPGKDHLVLVDGGVRAVSEDQVPA
ncbi:hypothetical protein [Actinomycetospora chibensis]|uniref:Type III secretion system (T3SS) SseB-like protein n=1 Tax=Actinomycetospora chibensis TaxID=663606 RepID=A0ABV9RAM0_9PSEU|nr:hypothetical protein [Actinomycetospora chibensis]MDD7924200.1 hypothetical protein [Actinomycetospora chibensis]